MKLVRQVLSNWKVGKNCQLVLNCDAGVMKMTMSADLGSWVQRSVKQKLPSDPPVTGDRGHKGPRRRAGQSYFRRQEKRAAAIAAEEAVSAPTAGQAASAPVAEKAEQESVPANTASFPAAVTSSKQVTRTCSSCRQPCLGHAGSTGLRCSNAQNTASALPSPEKRLSKLPPS